MPWSERQRAMLREMGIELWPSAVARAEAAVVVTSPATAVPAPIPASTSETPLGAAPTARSVPAVVPTGVPQAPGDADDVLVRDRAGAEASIGEPAVATMNWTELRAAVAQCRACPLCEGRRNTVFGVGHERAHWMIVGEAPGEQEDVKGEPFVGPAGQLLDAMLRALDLTRGSAPPERQVFIANTLKCRPPRNRNPEPDEMKRCEPFLQRQLALVQPRIILAMGRFAVQSLLRTDEPVGRLRGKVHAYQGVPLVVTYHPAYLLRQPADKARAWDDLCLAAETLARRPG